MIKKIRRWFRRDDGVVAVEFALIAIPLFTLILGIIETSLFFAAGSVLEGASNDAARVIRTGQAQTSADPEQVFREELCEKVGVMMDCDDIQYEVIVMAPNTFASSEEYQSSFDDDGNLEPAPFSAGNSNDIVLIRTVYRYEFLTPFLGAMMTADPARNWMMHISTVVLKAEPYEFGEE